MEVGLAMMLGIGPVQAACRKPSNNPSIYTYISNPPVHPSMIQQQTRRISPVRFFFDGLQNQLRSDPRGAQISVVVQHGALVASDIHHNKLHNEEWLGTKCSMWTLSSSFINLCGHGAVMSISSVFLFPCLFLPAFSLFLCPGQLAKGFERYSHITSRHYMSLRSTL